MTTTQVGSPTTPAPMNLTTTQADPSGTPIIYLTNCNQYIQKRDTDKATDHEEGDGTRRAPHRAAMKKLQF